MDPVERMGIIRSVRALLVRNYIDLGRLVIQISPGTVHLRGNFQRLLGASPLSPEFLQSLIQDIRRIPGVRRVITDFDNWTLGADARTWTHTPTATPAPPANAPPSEPSVHDLGDPQSPASDAP